MSYWGGAWSSLKFSGKSTATSLASGSSWSYRRSTDGNLVFKNNRAYKSVLVHVGKQILFQAATAEINKLFPRYQRYLEKELRKDVLKQQDANVKQLIENQVNQGSRYGFIVCQEGRQICATDQYGTVVPEALMLYYHGDVQISLSLYNKEDTIQTRTVCFIDLAPQISIQSNKAIVKTQVQGRDCTRKEMVAGGDVTFTISGAIVSNEIGVYPANGVQKFIQLAQHTGIIQVNNMMLDQLNISQLIIESFSLEPPTCKNIQPYRLTCVAVEPDEAVMITKDTIGTLNEEIAASPMSSWYQLILNNKLVEIAAGAVTGAVSSSIGLLAPDDSI